MMIKKNKVFATVTVVPLPRDWQCHSALATAVTGRLAVHYPPCA
jgi:hypothetical protein